MLDVLLLGAEDLVTGVTEPRHDIPVLVESLVHGSGIDGDVGMRLVHGGDALGCGDQHQCTDLATARLLQHVDGGDHRAAGGQHGVDDDRQALFDFRNQFFQVGLRLQGLFIASDADSTDLGAGDQAEHAVEHADAGAQDRHHGDLLAGNLFHLDRAAPAVDAVLLERQVLGCFVGEDRADFLGQLPEVLRADIGSAHKAEFVTDQRVADLSNRHGGLRRGD